MYLELGKFEVSCFFFVCILCQIDVLVWNLNFFFIENLRGWIPFWLQYSSKHPPKFFKLKIISVHTKTALRLLNSNNSPFSGRVEVLYRGTWGTICGHSWDLQDADVVCRQLGYDGAISAFRNGEFGQGIGPIWLANVQCVGNEISITQCNHRGWGVVNCRHYQDAGVVCRPSGTVQL